MHRHITPGKHLSRIGGALALAVTLAVGTGGQTPAAAATPATSAAVGIAGFTSDLGYWVVTASGTVFALGAAPMLGEITTELNQPIVGMAVTPTGHGYWLVATDGGVFPFGDGAGYGSTGGMTLNQPIVGMAATPTGHGYWLVAADGGVFPFGDAGGYGSTGGTHLNQPVAGMAVTHSGHGYWLVAADGGIFPFGDAGGYGSTGGVTLNQPVVGMAATATSHGYWLVAADGGIFPFGDAGGHGSAGGMALHAPVVRMAATGSGGGYWLLGADGGIFPFGDAPALGSVVGRFPFGGDDVASRPECGVPATAVTPGKVLVISLACQAMTAYQDGVPFLTTFITTGRPALATPPGSYSIWSKRSPFLMISPWPYGSPYWYAPSWTTYTMWFLPGFAIHDAPWRAVYGPGTNLNGSHGCVNVPFAAMQRLWTWTPLGAPVRIY